MATIEIREATEPEHVLVYDSILRTFGRSCYGHGVPARLLLSKAEALIASPRWRVSVAVLAEVPDEVCGFMLWRPEPIGLGWLQVKEPYRKRGVAKALLASALTHVPHAGIPCAFLVPEAAKLAASKGLTLRYRPYLPDCEAYDLERAR